MERLLDNKRYGLTDWVGMLLAGAWGFEQEVTELTKASRSAKLSR
jgi:hypothetical protein